MTEQYRPANARLAITAFAAVLFATACGQPTTQSDETAPAQASAAQDTNSKAKNDVDADTTGQSANDPLAQMDETCDRSLAERTLVQCKVCHSLEAGQPNITGPNLFGVYGRQAASTEDFAYSPTMRNSGIVWDDQTLDEFLSNPPQYMPGNRMAFGGVRNEAARAALICALKTLK